MDNLLQEYVVAARLENRGIGVDGSYIIISKPGLWNALYAESDPSSLKPTMGR